MTKHLWLVTTLITCRLVVLVLGALECVLGGSATKKATMCITPQVDDEAVPTGLF